MGIEAHLAEGERIAAEVAADVPSARAELRRHDGRASELLAAIARMTGIRVRTAG